MYTLTLGRHQSGFDNSFHNPTKRLSRNQSTEYIGLHADSMEGSFNGILPTLLHLDVDGGVQLACLSPRPISAYSHISPYHVLIDMV